MSKFALIFLLLTVIGLVGIFLACKFFFSLAILGIYMGSNNDLHAYMRRFNRYIHKAIAITETGYPEITQSQEKIVFLFNYPKVQLVDLICLLETNLSDYKIVTYELEYYARWRRKGLAGKLQSIQNFLKNRKKT